MEKQTSERTAVKWEAIGVIVALLALTISSWLQRESIQESTRLTYSNATQQIIHDQYELCRILDQMRVEHPEISHMMAIPAESNTADPWINYRDFKIKVANFIKQSKDPISADQLYLEESAIALHIFDIYEQTLFQWKTSIEAGDSARSIDLKMLINYYEGRMLRNPRLRYHWHHGGSDILEENPSRKRFKEMVEQRYAQDWIDNKSPLE